MRNASSVEFVTSSAQKDASEKKKTITLKPIYTTARDVVFVHESVGQVL
jgi:hypothetical protein